MLGAPRKNDPTPDDAVDRRYAGDPEAAGGLHPEGDVEGQELLERTHERRAVAADDHGAVEGWSGWRQACDSDSGAEQVAAAHPKHVAPGAGRPGWQRR